MLTHGMHMAMAPCMLTRQLGFRAHAGLALYALDRAYGEPGHTPTGARAFQLTTSPFATSKSKHAAIHNTGKLRRPGHAAVIVCLCACTCVLPLVAMRSTALVAVPVLVYVSQHRHADPAMRIM